MKILEVKVINVFAYLGTTAWRHARKCKYCSQYGGFSYILVHSFILIYLSEGKMELTK
jgi:hypothetical protein